MKINVINGVIVPKGKRLCLWDDCTSTFFPFKSSKKFCCDNHMKYYNKKYGKVGK